MPDVESSPFGRRYASRYGGLAPIHEEVTGENVPDRSSARRWSALAPLLALALVAAFAVAAFAGSPPFSAARLGVAPSTARAQYEAGVLGMTETYQSQSAGEGYAALPLDAVSGECAFEPDTCDKTYAGTFQYVDADCAYGGDGGVGCVGNQGCRFCRLISKGDAGQADGSEYTPRDLELNWCPPCVCEHYGVDGCAGAGYIGPFV
jgi:hypothetical protein